MLQNPKPGEILIVDDDPAMCRLLCELVRLEGYTAERETDSRLVMDRLQREPRPRVIILDLMMPFVTGLDLLDLMNQSPEIRSQLAVIVYTGDTGVSSRSMAVRLGADAYVEKTAGWETLRFELEMQLKAV